MYQSCNDFKYLALLSADNTFWHTERFYY